MKDYFLHNNSFMNFERWNKYMNIVKAFSDSLNTRRIQTIVRIHFKRVQ